MQIHCNESKYEYAGFWVRFAAYVIDMIIVSAALLIVRLILLGVSAALSGTFLDGGILFHYTLKDIILYMLHVTYFILLTYYTGTTLGKKALNLRVIRADGEEKLSLLSVIYRETIGRFLSSILYIGYIMAGLDKEKRGLHDILCDTRVIYAKRVKVYPVYQKSYVHAGGNPPGGQEIAREAEPQDVPQMVPEPSRQGDIQEQWKQILNPQNEEK